MTDNQPNECECCPSKDINLTIVMGMWMCPVCAEKEKQLQIDNNAPDKIQARLNESIIQSRKIDNSIVLSTDIFNAKTVAIIELKSIIDSDENITNKQYALAEELTRRYKHFEKVIFDARTSINEAGNEQRAIQTYLNTLANSLRVEEREKLKLQDLSYQPLTPKSVKSPKGDRKPRTSKVDIDKLRNLSAQYNVPMDAIQMLVLRKGMTLEDAAKHMHSIMHS